MDLGHVRQQHLVADLRLQRRRPRRRADRRPGGGGGPGGGAGGDCSAAPPACSGCCSRASATRPAGCSASPRGRRSGWSSLTRLRRSDPRTGWLIAIGGAFATTAVVFSFAAGIFHPYYVSFLAPFTAALVGAGVGHGRVRAPLTGRVDRARSALDRRRGHRARRARDLSGQLAWGRPLAIAGAIVGVVALALTLAPRVRIGLLAVALAALFAAPATWATETLGHATSTTFPAGGPASAGVGGPGGGPRRLWPGGRRSRAASSAPGGAGRRRPGGLAAGAPGRRRRPRGAWAACPAGQAPPATAAGGAGRACAQLRARPGATRASGSGAPAALAARAAWRWPGGFGGDSSDLQAAIAYAKAHGGGTIGVASQSSAARRSSPRTPTWPVWVGSRAARARVDRVVAGHGGPRRPAALDHRRAPAGAGALPGDTRSGSKAAFAAVAKACPR